MFTKKFWIDAIERSIKTFAQTLLAVGALDPLSADFQTSLWTKFISAGMAAVVSILTSVASTGFGRKDSASLIDTKGDDGAIDNWLAVVFVIGLLLGWILCKVGVG